LLLLLCWNTGLLKEHAQSFFIWQAIVRWGAYFYTLLFYQDQMISKLLIFILLGLAVRAAAMGGAGPVVDSLLPVNIDRSVRSLDMAANGELLDIESGYGGSGDHRKALARLLDMAGVKVAFCTRKVRFRLYRDLAKVSARLRMYPLAMRCYYNACKVETELPRDSGRRCNLLPVAFSETIPDMTGMRRRRYHLNHGNCTDFGLEAALAGGIAVREASGHWPLGHGNNPASAGQSLRQGKVADVGTSSEGLLLSGHTIKHLLAAAATGFLAVRYRAML
jgi:hypothetical protein